MPRDWDEHYSDPDRLDWTPSALLVEAVESLAPGRVLDLACGAGRNALYLARLGWEVTAVDRSAAAIRLLRERARGLPVEARAADLETGEFEIETAAYDLICDFYYLQRDLFTRIREGVRPGGAVIASIHLEDGAAQGPPHDPAFLLRSGELRAEFAGWKILYYAEGREAGQERAAARLIARRA